MNQKIMELVENGKVFKTGLNVKLDACISAIPDRVK